MADYLKIVYSEKRRPYTDYPSKLVKYLYDKFNLKPGMKILEPGCGRGEFLKGFKIYIDGKTQKIPKIK